MSVSYKKVNQMIEEQVDLSSLEAAQKRILKDLCKRIYSLESAIDKSSSSHLISELKGEVSVKADDFGRAE